MGRGKPRPSDTLIPIPTLCYRIPFPPFCKIPYCTSFPPFSIQKPHFANSCNHFSKIQPSNLSFFTTHLTTFLFKKQEHNEKNGESFWYLLKKHLPSPASKHPNHTIKRNTMKKYNFGAGPSILPQEVMMLQLKLVLNFKIWVFHSWRSVTAQRNFKL